jgi:hypothetical protein
MQSHQNGVTYYREGSNPTINLTLSEGANLKQTEIRYLEGKTIGLDPGFDLGMFDGTSSDLRVFTHLVEDIGIAFSTQALPAKNLESMVIPIGVKASAGKEITFSAEVMQLPTGTKVFLEDRQSNTHTRLDEADSEYIITLSESLNGIGRFYLHTSRKTLSIENVVLNAVHIYTPNLHTLRIVGLPQGNTTISFFTILGQQLINTSFNSNGVQEISLPNLTNGIYITEIQTQAGTIRKKILLK